MPLNEVNGIMPPKLAIVIPCYNEEEMIDITYSELKKILDSLIQKDKIDKNSRLVFVDDGSKDKTIEKLNNLEEAIVVKLTRNYGHQNALLAGLEATQGDFDCFISIDADLQDDIYAIEKMIDEYHNGSAVVYGVRNDRKQDSKFKRMSAQFFYSFMKVLGVEIIYNHADFRLLSKRVVSKLFQYKEQEIFLRGVVPLIGYKSSSVFYERQSRKLGESKYPLKKMIKFALNGIMSFSFKPLTFIKFAAAICFTMSLLFFFINIFDRYILFTLVAFMFLVTSIIVFSISLVASYLARVYDEVKGRPRYHIESIDKK